MTDACGRAYLSLPPCARWLAKMCDRARAIQHRHHHNASTPCRAYERVEGSLFAWLSDGENLLLAMLIILHLLPLWVFTYFPSQDGPAHLHNANVIQAYNHRAIFRDYYFFNTTLTPNWFGHLVLGGLMYVVPPLLAEKVLLSGYVVFLPLAMRYALCAICPAGTFLCIFSFPFIYNYLFHMGFYNFSYSLPMFFVVIGYWLKSQAGFTPRRTTMLGLLSLVLYGCHIFSLVTAYLAIGVMAAWWMVLDLMPQWHQRQLRLQASWMALRRRMLPPLYALVPALILVAVFTLQKGWAGGGAVTPTPRWQELYSLTSLVSYDEREGWFSMVFVWVFIAVGVSIVISRMANRTVGRWDGFLLVAVAYIIIYFAAPDAIGEGGFISQRMNLYPFFALVLWFGAQSYPRMMRRGIQIAVTVVAVALLALHAQKYAELNEYLAEYLSGMQCIQPDTTVLPLHVSPQGYAPDGRVLSTRVAPFVHATGYLAAQRGLVDLQNYEAWSRVFPLMFRPHLNPFVHIWAQFQSTQIDFLSYAQRTGGQVDYVLIWDTREEAWRHPITQFFRDIEPAIRAQLERGYELIYTSPRWGYMQLYRRQPWTREDAC